MEARRDSPLSDSEPDAELFARLSAGLRDAHRLVASLDASAEEKSSITRRLLAISDASKHDLARAARRLDVFLADLESGRRADPEDR